MSKLVAALKRAFGDSSSEPPVHFHQGAHEALLEVCFDARCARPRFTP